VNMIPRSAKILGRGDNRLNVIYAGHREAASRRRTAEGRGEIYNCSNDGDYAAAIF